MKKYALITGITGQDGSYLSELLLDKGYEVYGIIRRTSNFNTNRIEHIFNNKRLHLEYGDLLDITSIMNILNKIKNKLSEEEDILEVYNLAAQSHVAVSFKNPLYTCNVNAMGTLNLLEAIKQLNLKKNTRIYQASTSELYGKVKEEPQTMNTPFYPRSPYGVSKLFSYWIIKNYRETYGMYCVNGILFNHESPRRGETFVSRKITYSISKILNNEIDCIYLGNLNAKRDWGYAKDYVEAMWKMLQQDKADDYMLSTGKQYTIKDFVVKAFKYVGINIKFRGKGLNEVGYDSNTGRVYVRISEKYFRPCEVESLLGDSTETQKKIGWKPKTNIDKLIEIMMEHDLKVNKLY